MTAGDDWLSMSGPQRRRFTLALTQVYGWTCCICGLPIDGQKNLSCQHVLPRSKGGLTSVENCKPAHRKCNSAAGNRIVTVSDDVHDGLEWFARFSGEMIA